MRRSDKAEELPLTDPPRVYLAAARQPPVPTVQAVRPRALNRPRRVTSRVHLVACVQVTWRGTSRAALPPGEGGFCPCVAPHVEMSGSELRFVIHVSHLRSVPGSTASHVPRARLFVPNVSGRSVSSRRHVTSF